MTFVYRFFHYFLAPLLVRLWMRLRVEGREHLPAAGAVIIVSNHVDNYDSYTLGMLLRGRVVNFLARTDRLESRRLRWIWSNLGAIPADRKGLTLALRTLRAGGAIGVFPEGDIAPALLPAIPGSAVLALRSGAAVVPAAIWGTERVRLWSILARPRVTICFGPPRVLKRAKGQDSQAVMDELMREIAAMLPRRYRGAYAGPPPMDSRRPERQPGTAASGCGTSIGWPPTS